jgi:1,2-diacylglycerol 3-alpha-glucosyltransferase
MNIGIVTTWFERGAAYVSRQFEEILQEDYSVYIYARGGEKSAKGDKLWDKDNVYWGKNLISPFFPTVIDKNDFTHWLKKYQIEVVIFNEQHWFDPVIWCNDLSVKTIAYIDYYSEKTIPFFSMYDALICNTKRHYEAFKWHPAAFYIPWGTNVTLFKPLSSDNSLVNRDYVTFFHSAGYFGIRKGTDLLIRAFSNTKYAKKLIIHTQSDLKVLYPQISKMIESLISQGRLEVIYETVPAPGLYHLGDIYVYPSRLEGIGLTIAESLSCGLGILIPDNPPMNEFFHDGCGKLIKVSRLYSRYDGYYWPMCEIDINDLTNKIDYLANKIDVVQTMKSNSRIYAINNLNYKKNFKLLLDVIRRVEFKEISIDVKNQYGKYENDGFKRFNKYIIKYNYIYRLVRKMWR